MGYNRNLDRELDRQRREYERQHPTETWGRRAFYSVLAAIILFGLAYSIFARHGV